MSSIGLRDFGFKVVTQKPILQDDNFDCWTTIVSVPRAVGWPACDFSEDKNLARMVLDGGAFRGRVRSATGTETFRNSRATERQDRRPSVRTRRNTEV